MAKYLDQDGLLYFWQQLKTLFAGKVDKETGKGLSTNDFTNADVSKLNGIATGAEVNQNAFSNVVVGQTTLAADTETDTLTVTAGANVTLTPNAASDSFTIAATDTTYTAASASADGLMTSAQYTKLTGIDSGAEVNVIDSITVNGTAATVTNKTAAITTPTKTSDLTNDSGFITSADVPEGAAASTTTPLMDGTAATGTETTFARGDHIHPTDTSRAPLASPTFTGTPAAPTAASGTNTTQLATTAFVQTAISGKQNTLTFDSAPTSGSSNPVTSGGIYTALGSYLTTSDAASTYATKSEISSAYRYKGSVASVSDLPSTGNTVGDVYDVQATDMNYAWTGTAWDQLGSTFTITSISNAEIDAIMAA